MLLTVPVSWSRSDQERATRILFEYINVPGMFLLDQPVAALYGAGVTSGLVVDIGHTTTGIFWHALSVIVGCVLSRNLTLF